MNNHPINDIRLHDLGYFNAFNRMCHHRLRGEDDNPFINANMTAGFNRIADVCHRASVHSGWWTDPDTGKLIEPTGETFITKLVLIISEVIEAMEGDRKDLADDKLPHRKMAEVELADAAIRIFDLAGAKRYDMGETISNIITVVGAEGSKVFPVRLFRIIKEVVQAEHPGHAEVQLADALLHIIDLAECRGYDLGGAIFEKLEFNAERADHKLENRQQANGKAY